MMKTAIPCFNGEIASNGKDATEYTIVSGENDSPETSTLAIAAGQDITALMGALKLQGVERLLAGNLDAEYLQAAEATGFQVFYGASGTVADALNLIGLGILDSMANGNGCGCSGGGCSSGGCGGSCGTDQASTQDSACECGSSCGCGNK